MGTLGEDLKAAREKKGLTLKEISDRTRISLNFLRALEEENYSIIPGETFVTGFLRTYAKELGLKEKEVLARYREAKQPEAPPVPSEKPEEPQLKPKPSIISFSREDKEKEKGWPLWLLAVLGILLLVVPTVISLYLTRMRAPESRHPAPAKPMAVATTAFRPGTTFRQATAMKPRTTAAPAEAAPLKVRLTAAETTWYSVRKNGGSRVSAILKAGETVTFEAKDKIVLDVGNAGGVKLEYNGKVLKPYGKRGEAVKGITFTQKLQGVVIAPKPVMPQRTSHGKAHETQADNTPERQAVTESTTAEPKSSEAIAEPRPEPKVEPKAEATSGSSPLLFLDKK